jgi:hypothetical protein
MTNTKALLIFKAHRNSDLYYRDLHDAEWFDFEVGGCYACAEENYYSLMW